MKTCNSLRASDCGLFPRSGGWRSARAIPAALIASTIVWGAMGEGHAADIHSHEADARPGAVPTVGSNADRWVRINPHGAKTGTTAVGTATGAASHPLNRGAGVGAASVAPTSVVASGVRRVALERNGAAQGASTGPSSTVIHKDGMGVMAVAVLAAMALLPALLPAPPLALAPWQSSRNGPASAWGHWMARCRRWGRRMRGHC